MMCYSYGIDKIFDNAELSREEHSVKIIIKGNTGVFCFLQGTNRASEAKPAIIEECDSTVRKRNSQNTKILLIISF